MTSSRASPARQEDLSPQAARPAFLSEGAADGGGRAISKARARAGTPGSDCGIGPGSTPDVPRIRPTSNADGRQLEPTSSQDRTRSRLCTMGRFLIDPGSTSDPPQAGLG